MKTYLTNLLTEKGITSDIENEMPVEGHIGLTYAMQIDFICAAPIHVRRGIRDTFVYIDYKGGDVLDYWNFITESMLESLGY